MCGGRAGNTGRVFVDALETLRLAIAAAAPHQVGDGCPCARCIAHRLTLQTALRQTERNAAFAAHLAATRRRARRTAARVVPFRAPQVA